MANIILGTTTHLPRSRFRVLATDWEAEATVECWTECYESAETIARLLNVRDVTVQIDNVAEMAGY